jgi:hypothetical protein
VLTGAPPSASVPAIRDAEPLEIDGERFQEHRGAELVAARDRARGAEPAGRQPEPVASLTAVVTVTTVE